MVVVCKMHQPGVYILYCVVAADCSMDVCTIPSLWWGIKVFRFLPKVSLVGKNMILSSYCVLYYVHFCSIRTLVYLLTYLLTYLVLDTHSVCSKMGSVFLGWWEKLWKWEISTDFPHSKEIYYSKESYCKRNEWKDPILYISIVCCCSSSKGNAVG